MGTGSGLGMRRACSDALQIGLHALQALACAQVSHALRRRSPGPAQLVRGVARCETPNNLPP